MKNAFLSTFIYFIGIITAFAQTETCNCKTDLDFIVEKMKKMPSYKAQIKDEKLIEFETTYKMLSAKMKQPVLVEDCYKMLLQQILIVNDLHSSLTFNTKYLSNEDTKDESKIKELKETKGFKDHPKTEYNIQELEAELTKKPLEDLEGIYNFKDYLKIGVYYSDDKNELIGVVLENKLSQWELGQIVFYASHSNGIKYNLFYYHPITRTPSLIKSKSFENGRLWIYKKENNNNNAELAIKDQSDWELKQLTAETQYIYFGNFSSFSNENKKAFKSFYNKVKNELTAKNVIVDLRSNTGGNKKLSDPFLKLLKKKKVYLLTNSSTSSNAEQFTLKLKKYKNTKHLGQTTRGVLAYGINYGYNYNTPSGYFNITPTDMEFSKYLKYEGKGITPEYPLNFKQDWIEQTLEMIALDSK